MNLTEEHVLPSLRHLLGADERQAELFGIRAFSTWHQFRDPRDNWGMEFDGIPYPPPWLGTVHNKFAGERCFVLGTGPSLTGQLPLLVHLREEKTITCNQMRRWGELPFTPYIHCVTEPGPVLAFGERIHQPYDYPKAHNKVACIWWPVWAKGWLWLPKAPDDIQVRWQGTFGMNEHLPPVPTAWASPLTISQLALWMGFSKIYLLGVDTTQQGQAWDVEQGRTAKARNIRSILESADRVNRDIWRSGRELWDCTPKGRLNEEGCIPYMPLEEITWTTES